MGYPMTWARLIARNGLSGGYGTAPHGFVAGDMQRLALDSRDDLHLLHYAEVAGCTAEQAKTVLDYFFSGVQFSTHIGFNHAMQPVAAPSQPSEPTADEVDITNLGVRKIDATGDGLKMEFEVHQKFMAMLASGADAMLDHAGAANYVEMQFRDNVRPETVTFTVQRFGKITPHQKCAAAESRLAAMTAERDAAVEIASELRHGLNKINARLLAALTPPTDA